MRAAEAEETVLLVARPELTDPLYSQSILMARALPSGEHVGFILNRPTEMKMAEAFPGNEASKTITEPLYLGGPAELNAIFALMHRPTAPKDGALPLADNLYLAVSGTAVDEAMMLGGNDKSRFFVGAVFWRVGELAEEIQRGAWYVLEAKADLVLPVKTIGLREKLVQQAEMLSSGT